jgi:hypothetical protein
MMVNQARQGKAPAYIQRTDIQRTKNKEQRSGIKDTNWMHVQRNKKHVIKKKSSSLKTRRCLFLHLKLSNQSPTNQTNLLVRGPRQVARVVAVVVLPKVARPEGPLQLVATAGIQHLVLGP